MPYNSAADSFRTKQLCSRLAQRYRAKTSKKRSLCIFRPQLGGSEAGYDVHLRLIGKRIVDFLLVIIHSGPKFQIEGDLPHQRYNLCTNRQANECVTSLPLKVFTQRNFVADFVREKSNFLYGKRKKLSPLRPPLRGQGQRTLFILGSLDWKARRRLPISHN